MKNKSRNNARAAGPTTTPHPDLAALGIEPMNARSVILSALLGTRPPELPARSLVALAELFGIRPGTARTSLSRMVTNGELLTDGGVYRLAGRLLARQREQDAGRTAAPDGWNGDWIVTVAENDRRSMAERRAFRSSMIGSRLAELRPDIWMRPANVAAPPDVPGTLTTCGPLACDDVDELVGRLWPLERLEARARLLAETIRRHRAVFDDDSGDDVVELPSAFLVSAATVRFLRTEPQLPAELNPPTWTPPTLRPMYEDFNRRFRHRLQRFFDSVD